MRRKTVRRNDALPLRISYADILRTDPESVEHVRESKPPVLQIFFVVSRPVLQPLRILPHGVRRCAMLVAKSRDYNSAVVQ
jgi:hypothetical protein